MPETAPNTMPYFVSLPSRGLIHIEGADRFEFLQGLITNDVRLLEQKRTLYACLLSPQGKFLYDFFIQAGDGFLLIDCEGGERAQGLYKRLNMYRLRKNVQLSVEDTMPVYAVFSHEGGVPDPRHPEMGQRCFEKPQSIEEKPYQAWDLKRIARGIPDGSRDMIPEKSTLLESGVDRFNGISYEKGCYVGQELTARMHYRGLAKKHLRSVSIENVESTANVAVFDLSMHGYKTFPDFDEDIIIEGKKYGKMRSSCENLGLALLKDEFF